MSTQIKLSSYSNNANEKAKIGQVLDLEKKYFNILWNLFTSKEFIDDLKIIEKEIQKQYDFLQNTWELKNKLKIPAERLVRQYVYKNLSSLVKHIYPSAVSSDCAFITNDAVINIDIKTLDTVGNRGDIKNLQFENNQSSFENINLDVDPAVPNSGVRVECLLPKEFSYNNEPALPVLSFFFTIVYSDNEESFTLNRDENLQTIYLKCLPNGFTSPLFNNDIVIGFKTYTYLENKHGFPSVYLTDDESLIDAEIEKFVRDNPEFKIIHGRSRNGVFNPNQTHPKYHTEGVSWFPVSRQDKNNKKIYHVYLEAVYKGHTTRIDNNTIKTRYDSNDNEWDGVKKITIQN